MRTAGQPAAALNQATHPPTQIRSARWCSFVCAAMPQRDPKKMQTRILAYSVLGGKPPALQAAQLAVQSKVRREKEVEEAISDIGSNHYISDHFLKESS